MKPRIGKINGYKFRTEMSNIGKQIKKVIVTICFDNGESANIEFKGEHRKYFEKGLLKINDPVEVGYVQFAWSNKQISGNNVKGKHIKRI